MENLNVLNLSIEYDTINYIMIYTHNRHSYKWEFKTKTEMREAVNKVCRAIGKALPD